HDQPCIVGSIKTNIGHAEAAAGMSGLIKAAMCLEQRAIPASLHLHTPNPNVPWAELPVRIQQAYEDWPARPGPAFAGVSSSGITGTNAHIVLQEAPRSAAGASTVDELDTPLIVPLSAQSPVALRELAQRYIALLRDTA